MRSRWSCLGCYVLVSCAPALEEQPTLVESARLLAVVAEPAEARPLELVTFSPAVAGRGMPQLDFRFCTQPPSLSDPRPVAEACFHEPGISLEPFGRGARGTIPANACARFGPEPTAGNLRPRDADETGGFYVPVVVNGSETPSVTLLRVHCNLPHVAADLSRELAERYELNHNPRPQSLSVLVNGIEQSERRLSPGQTVELRLHWDSASREDYVWLPPDAASLEPRREALRVSWYSSAGSFATSATGSDETETASFSANTFTAPREAGSLDLWVVLQDSRGGNGVARFRLSVVAG